MNYIIPVVIILIIFYAHIKKVSVYDGFVGGAKNSIDLILTILPYLMAIAVMIEVFKVSGLSESLTKLLTPCLSALGIPPELTELIILRPFSGNGTLAILENIYKTYSPDSYISRVASVLIGSTDTIFYIAIVYFSKTKITKLRYGIPIVLIATFVGTITACYICKFL